MYISTHCIEAYIQVQLLFPYSMKRCTNGVETLESIWHMGVSVMGRRMLRAHCVPFITANQFIVNTLIEAEER